SHQVRVTLFFSNRRRHTRSKRDWSSDVCSSDLIYTAIIATNIAGIILPTRVFVTFIIFKPIANMITPPVALTCFVIVLNTDSGRSEERRVGKESSSRLPAEAARVRRQRAAPTPM